MGSRGACFPSDGVYLPSSAKAQRRPSGSMPWAPSQGGRGGGESDSRHTKSPDQSKEGASMGRLSPALWMSELPLPNCASSLSRPSRCSHSVSGSNSRFRLSLHRSLDGLLNTGSLWNKGGPRHIFLLISYYILLSLS